MKILILKPSSLGDVIQALPVLRLIKLHRPESEIFWWIDTALAPLLEADPDLAGLIRFDRARWVSPWHWGEVWQSARHLREHRFDWVIDLQGLFRSAVVGWLANGSLTVGLDDPREGAGTFHDVTIPRPSPQAHAVDWYLAVLRALGVPGRREFVWMPERPQAIASIHTRWAPTSRRWLAVHPGARWANKRWPAAHFAELVRRLSTQEQDLHFVILGGAGDRALGEIISGAAPGRCLNLTGQTSLSEMIEWIRLSEVMVTNDTGPMHVAAALNKPLVALFGPTEPRRTGPYGRLDQTVQASLPCVPCMKDSCRAIKTMECLHELRPEAIAARVFLLLKPSSTRA